MNVVGGVMRKADHDVHFLVFRCGIGRMLSAVLAGTRHDGVETVSDFLSMNCG